MTVTEAKEVTIKVERKCDLCGFMGDDDWDGGSYEVNETEISVTITQKDGDNFPSGGSGTKYEIDLCPDCFKDRLVPWLRSEGADIKQEDWYW